MSARLLVLLLVAFQISYNLQVDSSKLIQCENNPINKIQYNQRNGIDYYFATDDAPQPTPTVSANFKSILPANLALHPASVGDSNNPGSQPDAASGLPQVANNLQIVRGNGPRGRSAKQLRLAADELVAAAGAGSNNVCLTPGCVKAAAEILKNIDERVEPCDDFYRYACGNWIESQIIPEDKTSVSLFSLVQDELDNKLRNLIERQSDRHNETPIVRRMRNLYESCMNTSKWF